jgi:hypothetical protein
MTATTRLPDLGYRTCPCGSEVARCEPPQHWAASHVTLEEHPGGAWLIDDAWHARRVGLGHGDHRMHICDRKPEDGAE